MSTSGWQWRRRGWTGGNLVESGEGWQVASCLCWNNQPFALPHCSDPVSISMPTDHSCLSPLRPSGGGEDRATFARAQKTLLNVILFILFTSLTQGKRENSAPQKEKGKAPARMKLELIGINWNELDFNWYLNIIN